MDSVRGGGAYNWDAQALGLGAVMTVRAGAFYDSTATSNAYTRVDVNTLDKFGVTVGAGLKTGVFSFNVAYAEIFSPSRTTSKRSIFSAKPTRSSAFSEAKLHTFSIYAGLRGMATSLITSNL